MPERLFACRLAAKLGIPDVDRLQDSLTDEQFLEWWAVGVIDGWANGWQQSAEIIAAIKNATTEQLIARAANPRQALAESKFITGNEVAKQLTDYSGKPKQNMMTPEQAKRKLAAASK